MLEFVKAGGWLMFPIIACSIIALGIVAERFWSLRRSKIIPQHLVATVWHWIKEGKLDQSKVQAISAESALGKILATGIMNSQSDRARMKESIEEVGRQVVHGMDRFLNTLGTIAAISPLLGLLGTVVGMIKVFAAITIVGVGNPGELAGGISQALTTTAAGLTVAIIAFMFHRYFRGRVDELVIEMEQQAIKLVDVMHNKNINVQGVSK